LHAGESHRLQFFSIFIGNPLHRLEFIFQGQGLASLDIPFLLKSFDDVRKLVFFLLGVG
jgi:hypothetical protein